MLLANTEIAVALIAVLLSFIPAILGYIIGHRKGHSCGGLTLGLFFSWLGILVIALISPTAEAAKRRALRHGSRLCPHCREVISRKATICPYCQQDPFVHKSN